MDLTPKKLLKRRIAINELKPHMQHIAQNRPMILDGLQSLAKQVKGTELEGIPFKIALMRSRPLSYKEIAKELGILEATVRRFTELNGFNTLLNQMSSIVHTELIIEAEAVIQYHLTENKDKELAKWYLEVTGRVASSKPLNLTQNNSKTINVIPGSPISQLTDGSSSGALQITAESIAHALTQRMEENIEHTIEPPIIISQ